MGVKALVKTRQMAATLAKLLDGTILVENFIENVLNLKKTEAKIDLNLSDISLAEFVPFFLNFLRDKTSHHLASRQNALSPKKPGSCSKRSERSSNHQETHQNSSSKGLVFQSPKTPSPSTATQYSYGRREKHHGRVQSPVSSPSMRRKSPQITAVGQSGRVSSPLVMQSKLNLDDDEDFPPVGLTPKNKKTTTSRRITPTPVKGGQNSHSHFPSGSCVSPSVGPDSPLSPASLQEERKMLKFIKSKQQRQAPSGNKSSPSPHSGFKSPPFPSLGDYIISPSARTSPEVKSPGSLLDGQKRVNGTSPRTLNSSKVFWTKLDPQSTQGDNNNGTQCMENSNIIGTNNNNNSFVNQVSKGKNKKENNGCMDSLHVAKVCNAEERISHETVDVKETMVTAEMTKVTYKDKISVLSVVYANLLQGNLVPNLTSELYLVVQLLMTRAVIQIQDIEQDTQLEQNVLYSIHNCVQFAVIVLENIKRIVSLLDKGTLRLLAENTRISVFSPHFKEWLLKEHAKHSITKVPELSIKSPIGGVPFSADRDNRKNFPTDKAFQNFRKQRDVFYELVREWEDSHVKPGWTMEESMGNKIRFLVHQRPELANHVPFARLFQSQLLQMCKGENLGIHGESGGMLASLHRSNPDKFQRLQERFVTPLSLGSPCPLPTFSEVQNFFKGFILCAESHSFSRHLMDHLIMKILELNDTSFLLSETKEEANDETSIQTKELQHSFSTCLSSLRILAKFLGFLVFEPYLGVTNQAQRTHMAPVIKMRNKVSQPFNILQCIKMASKEGRLVLTVPWVVEYLSMMDPVAPYLDYYSETLRWLFYTYRCTCTKLTSSSLTHSHLLLITCLGWLFEIPLVPESFFFKSLGECNITEGAMQSCSMHLDSCDLVDQQLLYSCCPYVGELKTVLAEASAGMSSRTGPVKKITPVCADPPARISSETRQLLIQLEENFFRIQPEFLKRMSDFIIERLCSNILYHVKSVVVTMAIRDGAQQMEAYLTSIGFPSEVNSNQAKEKCRPQVLRLIHSVTSDTVKKALETIKSSKDLSLRAFESLCPQDTNPKVISTAAKITARYVQEKSADWIQISLPSIVEKELFAHFDKFTNAVVHNKTKEANFNKAIAQSQKGKDSVTVSIAVSTAGKSQATPQEDVQASATSLQKLLSDQTKLLAANSKQGITEEVVTALRSIVDALENEKTKVKYPGSRGFLERTATEKEPRRRQSANCESLRGWVKPYFENGASGSYTEPRLLGKDILEMAVLSTGFGKSMTFTRPGLPNNTLVLVGQVSTELAFVLACRSSNGVTMVTQGDHALECLIELWTRLKDMGVPVPLDQLLTTSHVRLITTLSDSKAIWSVLTSLCAALVHHRLTPSYQVEKWFITLLDNNTDQIFHDMAIFVRSQMICQEIAKAACQVVFTYKNTCQVATGVEFSLLLATLNKIFSKDPEICSAVRRSVEASGTAIVLPTKVDE